MEDWGEFKSMLVILKCLLLITDFINIQQNILEPVVLIAEYFVVL
jgi:hypothetical protein